MANSYKNDPPHRRYYRRIRTRVRHRAHAGAVADARLDADIPAPKPLEDVIQEGSWADIPTNEHNMGKRGRGIAKVRRMLARRRSRKAKRISQGR